MSNATQHFLVTGGAGFIGSHLVQRLLGEGASVTVIDDLSTGSLANLSDVAGHANLRVISSQVSTCPELTELAEKSAGIFHLAAAVGVELVVHKPIHTIHNNLRETEAILAAAARRGTPILFTSTSEVYGKSQKAEFCEEDDLLIGPSHLLRWSYACSKLMDEFLALAYAREHGLPVVVVRVFNTVGPRQTGKFGMVLPRFIGAARSGRPLQVFGDGAQTRCFCYVRDTVDAMLRLFRTPGARGQVVNIGGTEELSMRDLAERVVRVMESPSEIQYVPYDAAYSPGFEDMRRRKPSVEKLASLTGFRPSTPIEEIIRLTAGGS